MATSSRSRRNLILVIIMFLFTFGICYIKLKYFLNPVIDNISQNRHENSSVYKNNITETTTTAGSIHVALSVDSKQFIAVPNFINSLKKHSNNIVVHILVTGDASKLLSLIECCNINNGVELDVQHFELPKEFKSLISATSLTTEHGEIASVADFAQFFFHEIFPNQTHLLYFAVDSIIQRDITDLWLEVINGNQLITSVTIPDRSYGSYLNKSVQNLFEKRYSKHYDATTPSITGGIYGVNLRFWREQDIRNEILYWMTEQRKHSILSQGGTQPLLLIVAYGRLKVVSYKWNLTGLGWYIKYTTAQMNRWYILHWDGKRKPWLEDGLYKDKWNEYSPEQLQYCIN